MNIYIKTFLNAFLCVIALVTATAGLSSCQDDVLRADVPYTEGEPITLSLSVSVPQMSVQSRANIEDNELYTVKNVWIGVFNADTKEMTSYDDEGNIGWKKIENVEILGEYVLRAVDLRTKTGPSRIVAVANLDNLGTLADDLSKTDKLCNLLDDVRTWDEFLKVGVNTFSAGTENVYLAENVSLEEIDRPDTDNGIPMAGCYYKFRDRDPGNPAEWISIADSTVNIQEATKASLANGAIHLRRTISHITFNLRYAGDVIGFEPVNFKVCNAPRYSKFHETDATNFGDAVTKDNIGAYFVDGTYPERLYIDELEATGGGNPGYTFDFWMAENKHEGKIVTTEEDDTKLYNMREQRCTTDHSLFKYLLPSPESGPEEFGPNNTAAYVEISAYITYKEKKNVDEYGNKVSDGTQVTRTGLVTYTVHLGYIDKVINDFSNYRNCNYTYNMEVRGLESVRLEAVRDEVRNGVEGTVTDIENDAIILDSHYHQFNVRFSESDLTFGVESQNQDNQTGFGFTMTTFDNSVPHTYTENSTFGPDDYKYSDWIEIKSTTGSGVMATYIPFQKPDGMTVTQFNTLKNNNGGSVMPLREFYRIIKENQGRLSSVFTQNDDGYYYFTVFVKEYAYELGPESPDWGHEELDNHDWHTYVNQPDRRCYLRVRRKVSGDGQSVYARSLFSIEQRSIQTFYNNFSGSGLIANTAFGIEHTNETEGLNLRSTSSTWGSSSDLSNFNGRYNTSLWINSKNTSQNPSWSDFITAGTELQITKQYGLTDSPQNGPAIQSLETGWNPALGKSSGYGYTRLPQLVPFSGELWRYSYDPQNRTNAPRNQFIEAVNACMNRNRDENGNGVIDKQELKWYVPASGKYMRAILGRHSLEDPIMPYKKVTSLPSSNNRLNSRYLMYCSDNKVLWAMEGLSMSDFKTGEDYSETKNYNNVPWQVRCIRNLGTDLTNISNVEKVARAYVSTVYTSLSDEAEGIFRMTYYDPKSIRTKKFTASGNGNVTTSYSNLSTTAYYPDATTLGNVNYMPIHDVTNSYNMVYKAFEYGPMGGPIAKSANELVTLIWNNSNNPCYKAGTAWRLPNQKELAIMRNADLFEGMPQKNTSHKRDNFILSCSYNFFTRSGEGTAHTHNGFTFKSIEVIQNKETKTIKVPEHKFILSRKDGGTQSPETTDSYDFYYRCVRDVEP